MEDHFQMFYLDLNPHGQSDQYNCAKSDDHGTRGPWREFRDKNQVSQAASDQHKPNNLETHKSDTIPVFNNSEQEYLQNWAFSGDGANSMSSNSLLNLDSHIGFQDQDAHVNKVEKQETKCSDLKETYRDLSSSEGQETDAPENSLLSSSERRETNVPENNSNNLNPFECVAQPEDKIEVATKEDEQRTEDKQISGDIKQILTASINTQMVSSNQNSTFDNTSQTSTLGPDKLATIDNIHQNVAAQVSKSLGVESAQTCAAQKINKSPKGLAAVMSQKWIASNVTKTAEILKNVKDKINCEDSSEKSSASVPNNHMCYFCLQKFDCTEKLEIHEKSHTNMKPYRCSFCPRIFKCSENRNDHEKACRADDASTEIKFGQVNSKPILKPRRSRRKQNERSVLEIQIEKSEVNPDKSKPPETNDVVVNSVVAKPKIVVKVKELGKKVSVKNNHECTMCQLSFIRNGHLKNHLRKVHSVSGGLSCEVCKKFYATKEELEKHEPSHVCKICGKIFKFAGGMTKHLKQHGKGKTETKPTGKKVTKPVSKREGDKTCKVCGMTFKYNRSAREHEKRHFEPLIHKCVKCPRKFATEEKLADHQAICKSNIQNCKQCNKTFKYNYQLHMHIIEAHSGEYYVCKLCGQKFSNRGAWRTHEKLHTKEKEFKCSICSKEFHFKASLQDHMSLHSDAKPYQCMYCGLNVKTKSALKKHEGLHTGAFIFKCEYCDMTFNSRLKVSTHTQEKHTGREFICEFCGKAFTNSRFLKNHELIHTGEKPFKCPHCDVRFRRRHHVKQHIPRHFRNQEKQAKNDYVPMVFQQL